MSNKGGLPAISAYDIGRHWWLHELRRLRAVSRVHGKMFGMNANLAKVYQKELCKLRKAYYV